MDVRHDRHGPHLAARAQKFKKYVTKHALTINSCDGANNWTLGNLHLPTSWASAAGFKDAAWEVHKILADVQDKVGSGTQPILAGDYNADIFEGHRDERSQWFTNWLTSWNIHIGERDMPRREGIVRRGSPTVRHIDYILATTKVAQLGVWGAMHTRSELAPVLAAIMAKNGEVIAFEKKGPARLLDYIPGPAAARALARRTAGTHCCRPSRSARQSMCRRMKL